MKFFGIFAAQNFFGSTFVWTTAACVCGCINIIHYSFTFQILLI